MKRSTFALLLALAILVAGAAVISAAASDSAIGRRLPDTERLAERWTPQRLLAARPMPPPRADLERLRREAGDEGGGEIAVRVPVVEDWAPRPPSARVPAGLAKILIDPELLAGHRPARERRSGWTTTARGNFLLDFSSSRLVPEDARFFYPYSTIGKLFFSIGSDDFICSGAVVSARLVATAGHCVHSGEDGVDGFFDDFLFVPAYREGEAPFGAWSANFVTTTSDWADGGGSVPNEADFGFLVVDDIDGSKIGSVTGWLGWLTGNLSPNHVKMLGYPANLDRGERMHQVDSGASSPIPVSGVSAADTHIFGSDMRGGASGGPWVQNFGDKAKGQKGSKNAKVNRIVGVSSYASSTAKDQVLGSSDPGASFKSAFNLACSEASGNCSKKGKPKS